MATVQASRNVSTCPHYAPAGAGLGPEYVCRGCGALITNPAHSLNQQQGFTGTVQLARPESVNGGKRLHP